RPRPRTTRAVRTASTTATRWATTSTRTTPCHLVNVRDARLLGGQRTANPGGRPGIERRRIVDEPLHCDGVDHLPPAGPMPGDFSRSSRPAQATLMFAFYETPDELRWRDDITSIGIHGPKK